jgi:hypothetical protein
LGMVDVLCEAAKRDIKSEGRGNYTSSISLV